MRRHLQELARMGQTGLYDDISELLPGHQAALCFQDLQDKAQRNRLNAADFYNEEFSVFSYLWLYGATPDELNEFYGWVSQLLASGKDYDLGSIFYLGADLTVPNDSLKPMLEAHFDNLFRLATVNEIDVVVLSRAIDATLLFLLGSTYCPSSYFLLLDYMMQKSLPIDELQRLLVVESVEHQDVYFAKLYYLKMINELVTIGLSASNVFSLLEKIQFPYAFLSTSVEASKALPSCLMIELCLKLLTNYALTLNQAATTIVMLKQLINGEDTVAEYLSALSLIPQEQVLNIHFQLLAQYEEVELTGDPVKIKTFFALVGALPELGGDLKSACGFLVKVSLSSEQLSIVLTQLMSVYKVSTDEKKGKLLALIFEMIQDKELLADPRFKANLQKLAHVKIDSQTLKELLFEYMQANLSEEFRLMLYQQIVAEFMAFEEGESIELSALTIFFSESRHWMASASLASGVLKKIHTACSELTQRRRVAAINSALASFVSVEHNAPAMNAIAHGHGIFSPVTDRGSKAASADTRSVVNDRSHSCAFRIDDEKL